MNGDVSVRDVMRREYVGASEADSVADTASLMLEEDDDAAVVLRGTDPVGLVTQRDVLEAAVEQGDLSAIDVSAVMDDEPETVEAAAPLAAAIDRLSGNADRHLLAMDAGELRGVVSEHEVVTASALEPANGDRRPEPDSEAIAAAPEADTGNEEYSNQGICEICGSLTRDLTTFNGQLVCSDCKNV